MKCLLLAAGYATRLYPLTENFPKSLLEVRGKTILDWLVDDLNLSGKIDEYIVISNHKFFNSFSDWAKTKNLNIKVIDDGTLSNETRLGAVKDVEFAINSLSIDDDVLVLASDNVLDFSLRSFVNYTEVKKASCVMRYYEESVKKLSKSGVLTVDENDRVLSMAEKPENPESNWCCPPFYFFTREDARKISLAIKNGCKTDAPGSFISWLCKNSTVYAMEMPGSRYDIGNLESYENVKETYIGIVK